MDARPNRTYFRACHGAWTAPLDLCITSARAFFRSELGVFEKLSVLSLIFLSRVFGPPRFETTVDATRAETHGEVVHTTRVSKCGVTLMSSIETLSLAANGRDLTMRIQQRSLPFPFRLETFENALGSVDDSARTAHYRFPWFGVEMLQTGERLADGDSVHLLQKTAFSFGVQRLSRLRERVPG